jgi:addiction module RelE/StbE family toxin
MRIIYATPIFKRMSRDFLEQHQSLRKRWEKTIKILEKDVFNSRLKTHKLHGQMKNLYACRISYDYRIIFSFDNISVTLLGIGSHNEIY